MKKSILFLFSMLCCACVSNVNAKQSRKEIQEQISQTAMPGSNENSYFSPFAGDAEFGTESKIAHPKKVKKQLSDVQKRLEQIRKDIQQISESIA
jgi:TolA-binding protein